MRGEGNHFLLNDGLSTYIGPAITKRGFTLYDLGGFPGVVEEGNNAIMGEIYEISSLTLSRLDQLEGHPQFYRRKYIELQSEIQIEAYVLDLHFVQGCPIIKSGDWRIK